MDRDRAFWHLARKPMRRYTRTMVSRRRVLSIAMLVAIAASCKEGPPSEGGTAKGTQAKTGPLEPTDAVDPAFQGCSKSCGSRSAKDRSEAKVQKGEATVAPGDATYCPVSGAVFRITSQTPKREARGKTLYFCCDSCAAFFSSHEADVLAKRGIV